jgi:Fe-S-cluster-containing dehydrogenase component/CRP-like cAMP-binding protein
VSAAAWPRSVFETPVLRTLDDAARAAIAAAGRLVARAAAEPIYREGDAGDALYVVITGAVELRAVRRGDEAASVVRIARAGDSFGEEALYAGLPRRLGAIAADDARLAEIPIAVLQRALGRAGDATAAREGRYLERAAARDLISTSALGRELGAADLDLLLDGARLERFARGARVCAAGAPADRMFVVVDGLIQLQRDDDGKTSVCAYVARGDLFGDQDALAGAPRALDAIAAGDTWCAVIARDVAATLADRNPGLFARLRRVAEARDATHAQLVGDAAARSTQHVFRDLYRMQMARSLLVIDQDQCVRCGHCAWSCAEAHDDGVSRLIRRGDKVVTAMHGQAASLLLPNTCQHCRHAACMIDCPTGAIGRDPAGEIFIRPELCTGCGNCAKSCPWDNIQLAPRPPSSKGSAEIAVKCDLCRGYQAPACVEACPTGAVLRLDPSRDVAEVAAVLGTTPAAARAPRASWAGVAIAAAAAIALGLGGLGVAMQRAGRWRAGGGPGLALGVLAALVIAGLAAYAIPKRGVRARLRRRDRGARAAIAVEVRPAPRSRTRPHLIAHVALGVIAPALALGHAGLRAPASPAGALVLALALATVAGAFGALAYRAIPRRLTRLERRGALPEDLAAERDALDARLYRALTGADERLKRLAERVLIPYARARLGPIALALSGHTLAEEEARVRARIARALGGRTIDGADALVRLAVELRALPARRALGRAMGAWLPLHVVGAAMTLALLAIHVAGVVLR